MHMHGKNHPNVADSLVRLGIDFQVLGKYQDAQEYHKRALAIHEGAYGKHHPNVALNLAYLGIVLRDLAKDRDAQLYHQRALAINESTYGKHHPKVANNLVYLGTPRRPSVFRKGTIHQRKYIG